MKLWDVNLWVYAFRKDSPLHEESRRELKIGYSQEEGFLFSPYVAASFLRIVTNPKIFKVPSSIEEAWEFIDFVESQPLARHKGADDMTYGIFKHICLVHGAAGNVVPDAFLAALAIRYNCEFVTADGEFLRYKGLVCRLLGGV